jgi:DNA-binding response OmpR family regulator
MTDNVHSACRKILLIDDEPDFCEIFALQFQKQGFQVLIASASEAAFRLILEEKPSCIILDVRLAHGESGLTFLRSLRGFRHDDLGLEETVRRLPVVILTSASEQMKSLFLNEGANEYIVKPYDTGQLKEKILALIPS